MRTSNTIQVELEKEQQEIVKRVIHYEDWRTILVAKIVSTYYNAEYCLYVNDIVEE